MILNLSLEGAGELAIADTVKCKINIIEPNETATKLLDRINSDRDTSEIFARIILKKTLTQLWTFRSKSNSNNEKGKDYTKVQEEEKVKVDKYIQDNNNESNQNNRKKLIMRKQLKTTRILKIERIQSYHKESTINLK